MSLLRFAPFAFPFVAAACVGRSEPTEPITPTEEATATAAAESSVVAMSPITSANTASIIAAYQAAYPRDGLGVDGAYCVTIETDNLTFVTVTFDCHGLVTTTGTLHVAITSLTTIEATADLAINNVQIDGSAKLTIPGSASAPRTLEADLVVAGPRRELDATYDASWTVNGNCVTFSASGSVTVGSATKTFQIDNKTACHE